jgi:hypothetical protein
MSSKLSVLVGAGLMAAALASAAPHAGFQLLSAQEFQSELSARATPGAAITLRAADFDAPTITVIKPDRTAPIQPPVDIDVHFKAAQGASVNIASLKIMYGFLKLDVTKRIIDAPGVQVSAAGLKASGAQLPSGSHKLTIEVADNIGRTGRQPLEFTVK